MTNKVKYHVTTTVNDRTEYVIDQGTAYIVYVVMGGSGLNIEKVNEGDSWIEGVGEEFCYIASSEEEADDYIQKTYYQV